MLFLQCQSYPAKGQILRAECSDHVGDVLAFTQALIHHTAGGRFPAAHGGGGGGEGFLLAWCSPIRWRGTWHSRLKGRQPQRRTWLNDDRADDHLWRPPWRRVQPDRAPLRRVRIKGTPLLAEQMTEVRKDVWLLAGSIAPHAFGRRHWSIAKAWASPEFRNGLFRWRCDGAGSADDWTWGRLLLLTEQPLTRLPVQPPPSAHPSHSRLRYIGFSSTCDQFLN
jgi:hypothetical protein